jgi:hypothetical protein
VSQIRDEIVSPPYYYLRMVLVDVDHSALGENRMSFTSGSGDNKAYLLHPLAILSLSVLFVVVTWSANMSAIVWHT